MTDETATVDPDALLAAAVASDESYEGSGDEQPAEDGGVPAEVPAETETPAPAPQAPQEAPQAPDTGDGDTTGPTPAIGSADAEPKAPKVREYKYNRDDLIGNLRAAVKANGGKVPGIRQAYAKEFGLVQPQHFIRVFGDWNGAVEAAGSSDLGDGAGTFEPNRKGTKGSGRKKGIPNRSPEEIAADRERIEAEKAERKAKREAEKAQREAEKQAEKEAKAAEREVAKQAKAAEDAARAAEATAAAEAAAAAGGGEEEDPNLVPPATDDGTSNDVTENVGDSADGTTDGTTTDGVPDSPAGEVDPDALLAAAVDANDTE